MNGEESGQTLRLGKPVGKLNGYDLYLCASPEKLTIQLINKRQLYYLFAELNSEGIQRLTRNFLINPEELQKALIDAIAQNPSTPVTISLDPDELFIIYTAVALARNIEIRIPVEKMKKDVEKIYENCAFKWTR